MKLLGIATVSIGNAESCSSECPDGWSEFTLNSKSRCLINTGVRAVSSAAYKCASIGGRLPLPLNQKHNADLRAVFNALGAWATALDANDVQNEGQWLRADGTAVHYFDWVQGEPNNEQGIEDYAVSWRASNGQWNDQTDRSLYEECEPGSKCPVHVFAVCEQDKPKCCSTECPDGWSEFTLNGKSSCLMDTGVSAISSAAAKCASIGARLPLPLNQQHDTEMRNAFDSLGAGYVALDGNDNDDEGQWHKNDGTAIGYFNWQPGNPDNYNHDGVTESYLGTWKNGLWNDFGDASAAIYDVHIVCQQNKPECAIPTTPAESCDDVMSAALSYYSTLQVATMGDKTHGVKYNKRINLFKSNMLKMGRRLTSNGCDCGTDNAATIQVYASKVNTSSNPTVNYSDVIDIFSQMSSLLTCEKKTKKMAAKITRKTKHAKHILTGYSPDGKINKNRYQNWLSFIES